MPLEARYFWQARRTASGDSMGLGFVVAIGMLACGGAAPGWTGAIGGTGCDGGGAETVGGGADGWCAATDWLTATLAAVGWFAIFSPSASGIG